MAGYPEGLQESLAAAIVTGYEEELKQPAPDVAVVTNETFGTIVIDLPPAT
jgi:hypothetical protein